MPDIMEWFIEEPRRGEIALGIIAFIITAAMLWLGRRRLYVALPSALVFMLMAMMVIPSAIPARPAAQRNACINNLRAIRDAKAEWASQNNKRVGDIPTEADLYGTNGTNGPLRYRVICPRGGHYTIGAVGENPTCSFSAKGHGLE
jgi:hypothetical protein